MTPAEMVTEIMDYGFETIAQARLYGALNQALQELTGKRPWTWRESNTVLTFDGTNPYPSNVSFPVKSVIALTNPSNGYVLLPVLRQEIQKRYAQNLSDTGDPIMYYFDGPILKVYKIPGASVTLNCNYLADQADVNSGSLEADVLMPNNYHWTVIFLAVSRLYMKDDDLEMAAFARTESERLEALMVNDTDSRTSYDRPRTVQVVDEANYEDYN